MMLVYLLGGVLYVLSWAALLAGFVGILLFPILPYTSIVMAVAVYYITGCVFIRILGRLCGYRRPAAPLPLAPPDPVVIRRVIVEEITPYPADYATIKAWHCR